MKEAIEQEETDRTLVLDQEVEKVSFLERLKNKWQTKNILQVILILITFSIGGSICGILSKKIMAISPIEGGFIWVISYIVLATIIWPVCVFVISFFFGQQQFFKKYLIKMGKRIIDKKKYSK